MDAYIINEHLKRIFEGQARQERFDTSIALYACKQDDRDPVGAYVLKMIGIVSALIFLGFKIGLTHIDLIKQSLNNFYSKFVMNK